MDIAVVGVFDLAADRAFVAAINGYSVLLHRPLTVERLCQRARDGFQLFQVMAAEQVPMSQPPALQRTLQQLHALRMPRKIFERHRGWKGGATRQTEQLIFDSRLTPPNFGLGASGHYHRSAGLRPGVLARHLGSRRVGDRRSGGCNKTRPFGLEAGPPGCITGVLMAKLSVASNHFSLP